MAFLTFVTASILSFSLYVLILDGEYRNRFSIAVFYLTNDLALYLMHLCYLENGHTVLPRWVLWSCFALSSCHVLVLLRQQAQHAKQKSE